MARSGREAVIGSDQGMSIEGSTKTLRALNRTRGTILCERLEVAESMAAKSRGLLGRDGLAPGRRNAVRERTCFR